MKRRGTIGVFLGPVLSRLLKSAFLALLAYRVPAATAQLIGGCPPSVIRVPTPKHPHVASLTFASSRTRAPARPSPHICHLKVQSVLCSARSLPDVQPPTQLREDSPRRALVNQCSWLDSRRNG
jgi:hypothetical protein